MVEWARLYRTHTMTPTPFRIGLRAAALLVLAAVCAPASVTTPRGLLVSNITSAPDSSWALGSRLVRVQVSNPDAAAHRVRVQFGQYPALVSTDADIPAGSRIVVELPLPQARYSGADALFAIDESGRSVEVERDHSYTPWYGDHLPLYVSRSLSAEGLRDQIVEGAKTALSSSGASSRLGSNLQTARAADFADPWPADWRAYSVFAGVLIDARDLSDLPSGSRTALLDYAALGGSVLFVGADVLPPEFTAGLLSDILRSGVPRTGTEALSGAALSCDVRRCGLGFLATLPASVASPDRPPLDRDVLVFLLRRLEHSREMLKFDGTRLVPRETPPDISSPPVLLFLLILLVFSILAGPVAIRVLARRNRRIHILWVLPAISAVFRLAIILSLLLFEGVRPTLGLHGAVVLDQRAGRAISHNTVSVYSPLTLPRLEFPADAAVRPGDGTSGGSVRMGRTASYEGWLSPRTPAGLFLARAFATPLRLDIREDPAGGPPTVVNALGVPVSNLTLTDSRGTLWCFNDTIAPGASVTLLPGLGSFPDGDLSVALYHQPSINGAGDVWNAPFLQPRSLYRAELDGAPFLEDPLAGRPAKRSGSTVVFGHF